MATTTLNSIRLHKILEIANKCPNMKIHKVIEKDDFICYSYTTLQSLDEAAAEISIKQAIKLSGWKCTLQKWITITKGNNASKLYINIIYDKIEDKISIGHMYVGYGYAFKTSRIYPIRKRIPVLCISDKIYSFSKIGMKYQPRIYCGFYTSYFIDEVILNILNCSKDILRLYLPYRFKAECKSFFDVFNKILSFQGKTEDLDDLIVPDIAKAYLIESFIIHTLSRIHYSKFSCYYTLFKFIVNERRYFSGAYLPYAIDNNVVDKYVSDTVYSIYNMLQLSK